MQNGVNYDEPMVTALITVITLGLIFIYPVKSLWRWKQAHTWIAVAELEALRTELAWANYRVNTLQRDIIIKREGKYGQLKFDFADSSPRFTYIPFTVGKECWEQKWLTSDWMEHKKDKLYVRRGKSRLWVEELEKGDETLPFPFRWQLMEKKDNGYKQNVGKVNRRRQHLQS